MRKLSSLCRKRKTTLEKNVHIRLLFSINQMLLIKLKEKKKLFNVLKLEACQLVGGGNTLADCLRMLNVDWWHRQGNQNPVDDAQEYPSNVYTIQIAGD